MSYPNFVDYKNIDDIYYYKFYDINIIERNCMYPFTYNNINTTNVSNKNDNVSIKNNNINVNNFIQLPSFDNLILDVNGLPFIPLKI